MEKGITSFFGFMGSIEERMKLIKEAGFTRVMMDASPEYIFQNGTLENQVKIAKKHGLKMATLHASYNNKIITKFWEEGEIGDKQEKAIINELFLAKKYNFNALVVHFVGVGSKVGLDRIKRILVVCNQLNVPIAVENLNDTKIFEYILDNIDDKYLGVCLDIGHTNLYPVNKYFFKKYGSKIVAFHLHNNNSQHDMHTLLKISKRKDVIYKWEDEQPINKSTKQVDWESLAKNIAKYNIQAALDFELINKVKQKEEYTPEFVTKECYRESCELEARVAYYKVYPNGEEQELKKISQKKRKK